MRYRRSTGYNIFEDIKHAGLSDLKIYLNNYDTLYKYSVNDDVHN